MILLVVEYNVYSYRLEKIEATVTTSNETQLCRLDRDGRKIKIIYFGSIILSQIKFASRCPCYEKQKKMKPNNTKKNIHIPFPLDNTDRFITWPRYCSPYSPPLLEPQPRDDSIRLTREKFSYPTTCYYIIPSTSPIPLSRIHVTNFKRTYDMENNACKRWYLTVV